MQTIVLALTAEDQAAGLLQVDGVGKWPRFAGTCFIFYFLLLSVTSRKTLCECQFRLSLCPFPLQLLNGGIEILRVLTNIGSSSRVATWQKMGQIRDL